MTHSMSAKGARQWQQPRIPPVEDLSSEMLELTLPPPGFGQSGEVTDVYRVMLNSPRMVRGSRAIGDFFIVEGSIPPRDRELIVLRTAWLAQAPYAWGEHVKIAKEAGISASEVERVIEGATGAGWTEHERALLRAVEELHGDAMIADDTWDVLAKHYNHTQLVELPMMVGQYLATALWLNTLKIPLREGNSGLAAR